MDYPKWHLPEDRYFGCEPTQRRIAWELYESVAKLPVVSPHGDVDLRVFPDENAVFGTLTALLIIPDHYIFRMLYSQSIPLEVLRVLRADGGPVEEVTLRSVSEMEPYLKEPQSKGWKSVYELPRIGF